MSTFYSKEKKIWAMQIPIKNVLEVLGESYEKSGKEFRWKRHHSVTFRNNLWFQHSTQESGNTITFLTRFFNMNYGEVMKFLTNECSYYLSASQNELQPSVIHFQIPVKEEENKRMFAYLCKTRHISANVVGEFYKRKLIYQQAGYHNVVFAGYNEQNELVFAQLKGTFKPKDKPTFQNTVSGSDWTYGFRWEEIDDQLFIFEAPIDLLAYITLHSDHWQDHSYLALCGLSSKALIPFLKRNKEIKRLNFCLDHDIAGENGFHRLFVELLDSGLPHYEIKRAFSIYKDWDEDLKSQYGEPVILAEENPYNDCFEQVYSEMRENFCKKSDEIFNFTKLFSAYSDLVYQKKGIEDSAYLRGIKRLQQEICGYIVYVLHDPINKNTLEASKGFHDRSNSVEQAFKKLQKNMNFIKAYRAENNNLNTMKRKYMIDLLGNCLNLEVSLLTQKIKEIPTFKTEKEYVWQVEQV